MPNGINAPFGLRAYSYANGSPWNGATETLPIKSGLPETIYAGDPVCYLVDNTVVPTPGGAAAALPAIFNGSIRPATAAADFAAATASFIVGVFVGCKYRTNIGNSPQYITSNVWRANTVTVDGLPAEAMVITDPNVIFEIQTSTSNYAANQLIGASQYAIGNNIFLGLGNTGSGGVGAALPANVVCPDGSNLLLNPATGNDRTGLSSVYADIGASAVYAGATAGGAYGMGTGHPRAQLKIIGISPRVDLYSVNSSNTALSNNYAQIGVAGINTNVLPNLVASQGVFNNILVKINRHNLVANTPAVNQAPTYA